MQAVCLITYRILKVTTYGVKAEEKKFDLILLTATNRRKTIRPKTLDSTCHC